MLLSFIMYVYDALKRCNLQKIRVCLSFLICVLFVSSAASATASLSEAAIMYPAPGRLLDVGGRNLHVYCTGKGRPTVVLVAGGSAYSIDWSLVQPALSQHARVCSYDRAGLGWSQPGPKDETVEQTVSDLHSLLAAASEPGPFILVGASIGGIFIQAYQHAYPGDVVALVFDNSSYRIGLTVNGKDGLIWQLSEEQIRSAFPLPASLKGPAPASEGSPFDRLPPSLQAERLWLDTQAWKSWQPSKATPDSTLSWRKEFLREFDVSAAPGCPLGGLPVVVASSFPPVESYDRASRDNASDRLSFLSCNTVHLTAVKSGHEIHLYQPQVIITAVLRAISESALHGSR